MHQQQDLPSESVRSNRKVLVPHTSPISNFIISQDISDLFGADLPVEGGIGGQFAWHDGPLLQALKQGHWILLDELNLASQSVLEGLNACLDHRGEIFIPELAKTFLLKPGTRFFACQNPLKQGGSRRGLPRSFLNRFVQVYISELTSDDLLLILKEQFPELPVEMLAKMVEFNLHVTTEIGRHNLGNKGAPWEYNLRDLTRWCEALIKQYNCDSSENRCYKPESLVNLIYCDRMRTVEDREKMKEIFQSIFKTATGGEAPLFYISDKRVLFGDISIERNLSTCNAHVLEQDAPSLVLRKQLPVLRSLAYCVNLNWTAILVSYFQMWMAVSDFRFCFV